MSVLVIEGPTEGAMTGVSSLSDALITPASVARDRAEVMHRKSAESRWGHTILAFCRLFRLMGLVIAATFRSIKAFQNWTRRTEELA